MAITGCCARRKGREKVKVLEFHGRQAGAQTFELGTRCCVEDGREEEAGFLHDGDHAEG